MIGVDTNILVRYVARDSDSESPRAERFFSARTSADPAFVSLATAIETFLVLRRSYKFKPERIVQAFRALLGVDELVFQSPDIVRRVLRESLETDTDFADAVIALFGIDADCDYTVTFDKRAAKLPGMKLLGD
jgi:predicted nucleic-acid-binding protein